MCAQVKSVAEASNKCDQDCKTKAGPYFDIIKSSCEKSIVPIVSNNIQQVVSEPGG